MFPRIVKVKKKGEVKFTRGFVFIEVKVRPGTTKHKAFCFPRMDS